MLYLKQGEDQSCTKLICQQQIKQFVFEIVFISNKLSWRSFYLKQVVLEMALSQTSCLGYRFISNEFLKLFLSQAS